MHLLDKEPAVVNSALHASSPSKHPALHAQDKSLLRLTGGAPQTVAVTVDSNNGIQFSTATDPGPYSGIAWKCGGYSLMITFVFNTTTIDELRPETPSCWFSDTFRPVANGALQQMCCVPSIPGVYHFQVKLGNNLLVDPKIVVTPLPG